MSYHFNNRRLLHNYYKLRVPLLLIMSLLFFSQGAHASPPHIIDIRSKAPQCRVYSKPALHEALDKICYVCHEMFSHIRPNLRSECRSKCFRNEHFRHNSLSSKKKLFLDTRHLR
ncbi:unnamed protein product [Auanema sp. JU1783]|nr:unnamed protein product [Auanema sp. JU1783]